MKIWIVSCFLVAILLTPLTHAQGRGSRRFDYSQVVPKETEESKKNPVTNNLSRDHRFDTRGLRRPPNDPLQPQQLSLRSQGSIGQDYRSSSLSDINRRNGRRNGNDIRISQIESESLNQNTNVNDFSNYPTVNRRKNFKENYSSSEYPSRLRHEHDSLNVKATESFERRSPARSKPLGRDNFSSKTSFNEHEILSPRESEITERRSSRRGKSSISYIEVSTNFPSRKHSSVTDVPDNSQSRTRPRKTTTDSARYIQLNPNDKLEGLNSLPSHRSITEFSTSPTASTSQISEELSVTKESFKSNPRSRNLNSENISRSTSNRSKSRISNSNGVPDNKATLERNRNVGARTSQLEGRQDSVRSRNAEVRGNTRTRITEIETAPSSRNRESESLSRFDNVDKRKGNTRIVNENDSQSTFKSRNSDSSHIESSSINENIQKTRSSIRRGQSRPKETINSRHGSRAPNYDGTTEGLRSRSENFSKMRSRNENNSRGSFRSRNEETDKENEKYKADGEKGRTRNRASLHQNNGKYDDIQNLESRNSNRHRNEEILLPLNENITEKNYLKTEIKLSVDSNLNTSTSKSSENATLVAETNNLALDTQSEVDVPSSNIGYEVQESTEPILLELPSSTTSDIISNDEIKTKNYVNSLPESNRSNDRDDFSPTSYNRSQLSRSKSRKENERMVDETFVNKENKNIISRRGKENKRSRLRSSKDSVEITSTTVRSSRGRNLKIDSQPVSENSRRRKVSERTTNNSRNSPGPRGRIRVVEEEGSHILGRDSIETRSTSRKKDLTTDQTEVVIRSRPNSKNNVENNKYIETSNSALPSIRLQGVQKDKNGKVNEYKETSTKKIDENELHAHRLSLKKDVKDDSTKENEPKTNRGRGRLKHTADGVVDDQEKTSIGKKTKDKDSDDDVDEDANYPLEYIQLKKAGKGTKDILALLMARKKQKQRDSQLRENKDSITTTMSESTLLPRSLPVVQKRIPLDLKTEEDQVQPSIESPIISRLIPSRQSANPFRDLDPTLADPPAKLPLPETIQSVSSQQSSLKNAKSEHIDGKEKTEKPTEIKRENKEIDKKSSIENINIKSTRRKSGGKYSAQYRSPNILGESIESGTTRSFKPNRNSSIARNLGRSQNELIVRNTDKESEKISSATLRFIPSAKTTNVPEIDKTEVENTTPIKPRYQLYLAKDRKKLLDRRLGGNKDGNPTGFGEDLTDAKGNVESNTEKDGRWKRLKFGAASRPPYNPPRKSTSQIPKYTTTTLKSVSRFKSRKSPLLKRVGENEEIAFEASEDEHDPITVEYIDRIDLFSTQPPKLESANLLSEIVSTTVSNLESSVTPSQQPSESPLLNTVFDGEPTQQVTITPIPPLKHTATKTERMVETTTKPLTVSTTLQSTTRVATTSKKQISTRTSSNANSVGTLPPITTINKYFATPTTASSIAPKNSVTETLLTSTTRRTIPTTTITTKNTTPPSTTTISITTPTFTTTRTIAPPTSTTTTTTARAITPTSKTAIKTRNLATITTTSTPFKPTTTTTTTQKATSAMNRSTPSTTITPSTTSTIITTIKAKTTTLATTSIATVKTPKTSTKSVTKPIVNPTTSATRKISTNKPAKMSTIKSKTVTTTTPKTINTTPTQPIPKQKPTTEKTSSSKTINKKENIFITTNKPKQEITLKNPPTTISTTKITTNKKSSTTIRPQTIITTPMPISPVKTFSPISNSETLHSRSYSIDEIPSVTSIRPTRTPDPIPLSSYPTEPTLDLSSGDYVVYGLLPNKTLVRRVPSRTTTPPSELPFVVYGLYPNGTIVKRFPNGTVIPDDPPPQEANELVANVDPFNKQELSDILERDRPLAYLYPTYSTITTMAPTAQRKTTTNISTTKVKITAVTTVKSTTTITTKKPTTQTPVSTKLISKKPLTTPKPTTKMPLATVPRTVKSTTKTTTTKPKPVTTTVKTTTKPTFTTTKPIVTVVQPITLKPTTTNNIPVKNIATTKKPTTSIIPTTLQPIINIAKTTVQNKILSTTSGQSTIRNSEIKSTTDPQSRLAEDFALLNTLLKIQDEQSGNSIAPPYSTPDPSLDDDDLANRIIQLAIERAQASTESSTSSKSLDLQELATGSPVDEVESSSNIATTGVKKASSGGKISLWVVPNEETSSPKSPELTPQEEQVLNALLKSQRGSTPPSIQDQILLAELLGGQSTTKRPRKKKKKPRASTTPRPPPLTGLAALISGLGSGNQAQGGGFFGSNTATTGEEDSLPDDRPRNPGILVTAAINITKAVSQFMGIILQGAAQSFQNFVQSRTRAFSDYLTYNGSNGG